MPTAELWPTEAPEVIKVEAPAGRPAATVVGLGGGHRGRQRRCALQFLGASKHNVVVDPTDAGYLDALHVLLASADAVVWSPGSPLAEQAPLHPREVLRAHPHLVATSITPFGLDGPWSDKAATEFTLQAWSGGIVGLAGGGPIVPPCSSGAK